MTGMKEGAGEDPFADDDTQSEPAADEPTGDNSAVDKSPGDGPGTGSAAELDTTIETDDRHGGDQQSLQIPYKFRRDGVQDGRDRVPLFIHEDTKSEERDAQRELEDRFNDDVSLTDLREAVMKAGLQHLDEVEANLEEWGYGMTFDE